MKTYKYTDSTRMFVHVIDDDGISRMSVSSDAQDVQSWIAAGNAPEPADKTPNPRIAEIKSRLAQIDIESIRAIRSKTINRGQPADDSKLGTLDDEAAALRAELSALPALV